MSEDSGDLGASSDPYKIGPDYFAFYTREVEKLISPDEDFLPFSSQASEPGEGTCGVIRGKDVISLNRNGNAASLLGSFAEGIGAGLSEFKKDRLKSMLQQSVVSLSQEVDEMLDPVLAIRQIQAQLMSKKSVTSHSAAACESDLKQRPRKMIKLSSLSSLSSSSFSGSSNEGEEADLPENEINSGAKNQGRICANCHTTKTFAWRTGPEGPKTLCNACGLQYKEKVYLTRKDQSTEFCPAPNIKVNTEDKKVNNDVQSLLQYNTANVESSIKKYSDELFMTLDHMEQQLEGLLDLVQSSNRLLTLTEKQQLQKLIQKLPPRNLDRVVEIIRRNNPLEEHSSDEIHVDLEEQDNVTLWRLYIYVKAVENARKLAG